MDVAEILYAKSLGGGTTPTGEISITKNGTYNVTDKATAIVNTPVLYDTKQVTIVNNTTKTVTIGFINKPYTKSNIGKIFVGDRGQTVSSNNSKNISVGKITSFGSTNPNGYTLCCVLNIPNPSSGYKYVVTPGATFYTFKYATNVISDRTYIYIIGETVDDSYDMTITISTEAE